MNFNAG